MGKSKGKIKSLFTNHLGKLFIPLSFSGGLGKPDILVLDPDILMLFSGAWKIENKERNKTRQKLNVTM